MIVLDASVLIAQFDARDALHGRAVRALSDASGESLGASTVTLAEILVGPARAGRLDDAHSALRDLGVAEVPLPAGAVARLAELRAQTGLRLPDCCVLLSAQQERASLLTFDDRMGRHAKQIAVDLLQR